VESGSIGDAAQSSAQTAKKRGPRITSYCAAPPASKRLKIEKNPSITTTFLIHSWSARQNSRRPDCSAHTRYRVRLRACWHRYTFPDGTSFAS
jgi:hypothetical protein